MYLFLSILLLVVIFLVYLSYKKSGNSSKLIRSVGFIAMVIFFTYISKVIFIHKPLFIIHLALVILSWGGLFFYLIKDRLYLWMILSPLFSTLFFFAMALFFKENG
jgi:hypothetical protein